MGRLSGTGVEITPLGEQADISGYFQIKDTKSKKKKTASIAQKIQMNTEKELKKLFAFFDCSFSGVSVEIINEQDWSNSWKKYFNTFEIVPGLVIKPSWEEYLPSPGQHVLELDPGMAFGTGQHASTQLVLSLMRQIFEVRGKKIKTVLDVGTGTGILGMSAALFGAVRVVAIDNDPEAVQVALDNVKANRLEKIVEINTTSLDEIQGHFDCICANIVHDVLINMAPKFGMLLSANGFVILSGILQGNQEKNITSVLESLDLKLQKSQYKEEWVALLFKSK